MRYHIMSMRKQLICFFQIIFIIFIVYAYSKLKHVHTNRSNITTGNIAAVKHLYIPTANKTLLVNNIKLTECPDVLNLMTRGKWESRNITRKEEEEMDTFLLKTRTQYLLPSSLQRKDGKCGNVTFELPIPGFHNEWFRALCDPKGLTPCCHSNVCTNLKHDQCDCPDCYDFRRTINAEYASWLPDDKNCLLPTRNSTEMCQSLDNMKINFIGDSFIRHIYLAFILLLNNNTVDGAMIKSIPTALHNSCVGFYMFTEKQCRPLLDSNPVLCNSRVQLRFFEFESIKKALNIRQLITSLPNQTNIINIIGLGIHDNFNISTILSNIILPILQERQTRNRTKPKLLWHAAHAPGILKSPWHPAQSYKSVFEFNQQMNKYLNNLHFPVFDSFNLTDGVNSFDGAHYGLGVNLVKARILIEYVNQLRKNEKW